MEFGIRVLLLLAAAIVFLIAIFASVTRQLDLMATGLLLVALALIVVDTPLAKMRWNTTQMGGGSRPRE